MGRDQEVDREEDGMMMMISNTGKGQLGLEKRDRQQWIELVEGHSLGTRLYKNLVFSYFGK